MNRRPTFLLRAFLAALACVWLPTAPAQGQTAAYATVCLLGGDPNGYHPRAGLVLGADGNFYGTSEAGGPANFGTIFQITPAGALTTIYTFTGGSDGANPATALVSGGDGNFYGTTQGSFGLGSASTGTVFRVTPAGVLTTIYRFSALTARTFDNSDGAFPNGSLLLGSDGNLYGTTQYGGANGVGTVFRITLAGALTTILTFNDAVTTGSFGPSGALAQGNDGNFYGTTAGLYGANSGTIYQVTPAGALTTLYRFTGGADGEETGDLSTALTLGADGNFYGTTPNGKAIFKITPAGAFTVIHTLNSATEGSAPSMLTRGADGNFYGTTNSGGAAGNSTIYQVTPAGVVTVLFGFGAGGESGLNPNPLVQAANGTFYSTTRNGGNGDAGMVYSLNASNAMTPLYLFNAGGSGSAGRLLEYTPGVFAGTTETGGTTGGGTIFGCTSTGIAGTLHSFDIAAEGSAPKSGLIEDAAGNFFGTTSQGGAMDANSVLRPDRPRARTAPRPQIDLPGLGGDLPGLGGGWYDVNALPPPDAYLNPFPVTYFGIEIIYNGDFTYGHNDRGEPVCYFRPHWGTQSAPVAAADDAVFYGTSASGGDNNEGVVYSITATGMHTVLHQFGDQPGDGSTPTGGLIEGTDGNLYGTTSKGGANGLGTVFSMTPAGTLTTLYSFAGTGDGAIPAATLTQGSDGNFYGVTQYASYSSSDIGKGNGTIFKITPAGTLTTLHTFATNGSEGGQARATLLLASDGNFYGTTSAAGVYPASDPNYGGNATNSGTVFSITPAGVLTTIHTFGTAPGDGAQPLAALIEASDGNLYGTTANGGTDDCGVVFKVALNGAAAAAPVITSAGTASGQAGAAFTYQITATNSPTSFTASGLPAGLSVDDAAGLISGTITATPGAYAVTLGAANASGAASASLMLTVSAQPVAAPVITSAASASAQVGVAFTYQIAATNAPTGFGATGLPDGLSVNAAGLIAGVPARSGSFPIGLSASNAAGGGTATLNLTVTATPVIPPVITSALGADAQVGQPFSYQIAASKSPTSYSAAGVPPGLSVDAATGLISGTPTQAGAFSVALGAANAGGTGAATLTLTVTPALPVVTLAAAIPSVTIGSGDSGKVTVLLSQAQAQEITVKFKITGSAVNGTDYALLPGKVKFPPGKTKKQLRITPIGDLGGAAKKTVKITLKPEAAYTAGPADSAKVKILRGE